MRQFTVTKLTIVKATIFHVDDIIGYSKGATGMRLQQVPILK